MDSTNLYKNRKSQSKTNWFGLWNDVCAKLERRPFFLADKWTSRRRTYRYQPYGCGSVKTCYSMEFFWSRSWHGKKFFDSENGKDGDSGYEHGSRNSFNGQADGLFRILQRIDGWTHSLWLSDSLSSCDVVRAAKLSHGLFLSLQYIFGVPPFVIFINDVECELWGSSGIVSHKTYKGKRRTTIINICGT